MRREPDNPEIRTRLRQLAGERRRFGYRRLGVMLEREGIAMNGKKLFRLHSEVATPDGAMRRETTEIAFRRPDPERFAAILGAAGFGDVTLRDASGSAPVRGGGETYVALARTG